jgi:hypothetical protein
MKWVVRRAFAQSPVTVRAPKGVFELEELEDRAFLVRVLEFFAGFLTPAVVVLDREFLRDKQTVREFREFLDKACQRASLLVENNGNPDFQAWLTPDCSGASEEEVRVLLGIYTGAVPVVSSPQSREEQ